MNAAKLSLTGWLLEQQEKTEAALNHLRNTLGTYRAEKDPTYNFLEGYASALAKALSWEEPE